MNLSTKNTIANVIVAGIASVAFPLILAYTVLAEGFALMHMWDWFLSEPFGLPRLGILHAAGISGIVGLMAHQFNYIGEKSQKQHWTHIALNPWIRLGVAWVLHTAMVSL